MVCEHIFSAYAWSGPQPHLLTHLFNEIKHVHACDVHCVDLSSCLIILKHIGIDPFCSMIFLVLAIVKVLKLSHKYLINQYVMVVYIQIVEFQC